MSENGEKCLPSLSKSKVIALNVLIVCWMKNYLNYCQVVKFNSTEQLAQLDK